MLETATVKYETNKIGVRDIIVQIQDIGFDASLQKQSTSAQNDIYARKQRDIRTWLLRFIVAFALSLPMFIIAMIVPWFVSDEENPFMTTIVNGFTVGML